MRTTRAKLDHISQVEPVAKRFAFLAPLMTALLAVALTGCGRKSEPSERSRGPRVVNRESTRPQPAVPPNVAPGRELPPPRVTPPSESRTAPDTASLRFAQVRTAESKLPVYELRMEPSDVMRLDRSGRSNQTFPATFIAGGRTYDGVKVRLRGDWARTWPKKCLKIFFDKETLFEGQDRINLNSAWRDPAFVREPLAYQIYAACGVPASRSRMVRLDINGQFRGLYVEVEQPDKHFLKRVGLKGAAIYKADSRSNRSDERDLGTKESFANHYEKESRKSEDCGDLQEFCQELARTTDVPDFFNGRVDLETYINYLAATVLVQNWDCYNKNHFIVHDERGSGKWLAVPWDLDRTLGDHWHQYFGETSLPVFQGTRESPGPTGWNRLADRFFSEPVLRARFLDRLDELLEKEFTTEKLFPILDGLEAEIGTEAKLDRRRWRGPAGDLHSGIVQLKTYVERRRAFLRREIANLRRDNRIR